MRRLFLIALAAMLILSGCGSSVSAPATQVPTTVTTAAEPAVFRVGFGEADITPTWNVGLLGHGNEATRISTTVRRNLFAHVLAVTDEAQNTALLISLDLVSTPDILVDHMTKWCTETYGIPRENVLMSSIHQHSTPVYDGMYSNLVEKGMKKAIAAALEDRQSADMYINTVQTQALSFVRHYWTNNGTICGDNYGSAEGGLKCHESESDKDMQLVKFTREGKDIIVVNFQAHPHLSSSSIDTAIDSDWPGIMRMKVAGELGCHVMYFSGAGGNLNSNSRIDEENVSVDYLDHGKRAAEYVIGAEDSYTQVRTGTVAAKQLTIAYDVDHSMDHLLGDATAIHSLRHTQGIEKAVAALANYPAFSSIYHVSAVVDKAALGETKELTISAISVGDVAFTAHPYEMFDTNGMELKSGTVGNPNYEAEDQLENPYAMTIVTTQSNGSVGYIPSRLGYTNGGYSTDITKFAAGTGEILVGDYLHILQQLHSGN